MMITTHIQDTSLGVAGGRIPVELDFLVTGHGWKEVGYGITNAEGRIEDFGETAAPGIYRLMFDIASYAPDTFFPSIAVTFEVLDPSVKYHIVLVLSRFGYSTYRET